MTTHVARGTEADLDAAVHAARRAFDTGPWPRMSPHERAKILWRVGELIDRDRERLAFLETVDSGKPIRDNLAIDVPFIAELFRYYAGAISKIEGTVKPGPGMFAPLFGETLNYTLREPIGVVGGITPFNFPLVLSCFKIAPALAAGNTFIHKPASGTSLSAVKLAELIQEAGVPDGVFNLLTGPGAVIGKAMALHPGIDKIAFTGETETGRQIIRDAAGTLKRVTMELGGKSPNLVFADADINTSVQAAFFGIFYNKGEICFAGSRLFVERPIYEAVLDGLTAFTGAVKPGDPLNPDTVFGPLASQSQLDKTLDYVRIGRAEGAAVRLGGAAVTTSAPAKGTSWNPPSSPTPQTTCASPGKRFLVPC